MRTKDRKRGTPRAKRPTPVPPELPPGGAAMPVSPEDHQALTDSLADSHATVERRVAMLEEQVAWLIVYSNRLLDKYAGTQLTSHTFTIEQANEFVGNERQAANQQMQVIKAKHFPPPAAIEEQSEADAA